MAGDYTEALFKDLKRLSAEAEKLAKAHKKDAKDAKLVKAMHDMKPFLEEASLKKRFAMAEKMDLADFKKLRSDLGF